MLIDFRLVSILLIELVIGSACLAESPDAPITSAEMLTWKGISVSR